MKYYVVEFQTNENVGSAIPLVHSTLNNALALFHHQMEYAQTSAVEKHGSVIFDENMSIIRAELGHRETASTNLPVFFVLEFQTSGDQAAMIPMAYADKADAWEKYHQILQYAAKSAVEKHGAMMITSDLFKVVSEMAERAVVEPVNPDDSEPENGGEGE